MWHKTPAKHIEKLQVQDLAVILGVHRNTIRKWIATDVLDPSPAGLATFLATYTNWRHRLP